MPGFAAGGASRQIAGHGDGCPPSFARPRPRACRGCFAEWATAASRRLLGIISGAGRRTGRHYARVSRLSSIRWAALAYLHRLPGLVLLSGAPPASSGPWATDDPRSTPSACTPIGCFRRLPILTVRCSPSNSIGVVRAPPSLLPLDRRQWRPGADRIFPGACLFLHRLVSACPQSRPFILLKIRRCACDRPAGYQRGEDRRPRTTTCTGKRCTGNAFWEPDSSLVPSTSLPSVSRRVLFRPRRCLFRRALFSPEIDGPLIRRRQSVGACREAGWKTYENFVSRINHQAVSICD